MNVSLGQWEGVKQAKSVAGWMLIFSAVIDTLMSLDFAFNQGELSLFIVAIAHLILLPVLAVSVVVVGLNTQDNGSLTAAPEEEKTMSQPATKPMAVGEANEIVSRLEEKLLSERWFLDPELTLSRLSRKLTIPAKQISIAVNQVHNQSISRFINAYRIEHAQRALIETSDPVTQIFMRSGFQTKSNFNREFSRIVGMTPSAYRKQRAS